MRFRCHVGAFGAGLALPEAWHARGPALLARAFAEGSARGEGAPGVRVHVLPAADLSHHHPGASPTTAVLHDLLRRLKGLATRGPVADVGLLFASRHPLDEAARRGGPPGPGLFGLLFDPGFFLDGSPGGNVFTRVPREGCVVFLDTIRDHRAAGDVAAETLFTAVHELGHVWNLWHAETPTHMFRSATRARPVPHPWHFAPRQRAFLARCPEPDALDVRPGGTPFGVRDPRFPQRGDLADAAESAARLRLHLGLRPRSFWPFEPVELEIALSLGPGRTRAAHVHHALDAGYERFQLWIEEPDGTRRRYRAPLHYCEGAGRLRIERGHPFRRDVSIFGESGGYTFRRPGRHRIQAHFRLPRGRILRSNRIELEVRAPGRGGRYEELREVLTRSRVAQLLFYRHARGPGAEAQELEAFARRHARSHVGARLLYALGRAHAGAKAPARREAGRELLAHAAQLASLGEHQRRVAERLLEGSPRSRQRC